MADDQELPAGGLGHEEAANRGGQPIEGVGRPALFQDQLPKGLRAGQRVEQAGGLPLVEVRVETSAASQPPRNHDARRASLG